METAPQSKRVRCGGVDDQTDLQALLALLTIFLSALETCLCVHACLCTMPLRQALRFQMMEQRILALETRFQNFSKDSFCCNVRALQIT